MCPYLALVVLVAAVAVDKPVVVAAAISCSCAAAEQSVPESRNSVAAVGLDWQVGWMAT